MSTITEEKKKNNKRLIGKNNKKRQGQISSKKRGPKNKKPSVTNIAERKYLDENLKRWLSGKTTEPHALYSAKLLRTIATLYPTTGSVGAVDTGSNILDRSFNSEIKVKVPLSISAIYGWACGFMSYAYKQGYLQVCAENNNTNYPAFAWNFIVEQLIAAANNQLTASTSKDKIPIAMRDIIAALIPKKGIPFPQGALSYSWDVPTSPNPFFEIPYPQSTSPTGGQYRMYEATTTVNSGGYTVMAPPSGSYTSELGAIAFNDVAGFLQQKNSSKGYTGVTLVSTSYDKSPLYRSPACFAYNSTVLGDGDVGGAFNAVVSLELPRIDHPQFSVFTVGNQKTANVRAFNSHHPNGGDGNYLSIQQLTANSADDCKNKLYPVFKPVDIFEVIHRYALVLADVFQKAANDTTITMQYANLGMTGIDFCIMMYQQIMWYYSDTQISCQSVLPYRGSSVQFTPFIIDSISQGCDSSQTIKVPKYFNMNLQALTARVLCTTVNPKFGTSVQFNKRKWIPMWGQYTDWSFDPKDYVYTKGEDSIGIFLDTTDTFNLYLGMYNQDIINMGSSPKIFQNIALHNKIVSTYSSYIQELDPITKEPGASIFEVIGETLVLKETQKKLNKNDKVLSKGKEKKKEVTIVIKDKVVIANTSQKPVISEVSEITKNFVKPEIQEFAPSGGASGSISPQTWEVYSHEAYLAGGGNQNPGGDNDLMDLEVLRQGMVSNCTKNRGGDDTLAVKIAEHFDDTGKGGLLDTLATVSGSVLQAFVGTAPLVAKMMTV